MKNYYATLEASPASTLEEIRQSYRRLAQEHIRDEAAFSDLMEAYEVLSNPTRRAEYDQAAFGGERTLAAPASLDRTAVLPSAPARAVVCPMAAGPQCPVQNAPGLLSDTFCPECGVVLESLSAGGDAETVPVPDIEDQPRFEEQTGRAHPLRPGLSSVGREGADVLLADRSISRQHAQVEVAKNGSVFVEDLGSTNSTRVNGVALVPRVPRVLADGDLVRFGNVSLTVRLPARPETMPTAEPPVVTSEPTAILETPPAPAVSAPAAIVAPPRLRLRGTGGPTAREILLSPGETTLGRRPENTIALSDDRYLSGRHVRFDIDSDIQTITDVGSSNGTTLNGARLAPGQPARLAPGDRLALGGTTYLVEEYAEEEPTTKDGPDDVQNDLP